MNTQRGEWRQNSSVQGGEASSLALVLAGAVCTVLLLAMREWKRSLYFVVPADVYLPVHTVLEIASMVVSFAVFVSGWHGYKQTRNKQDLFVAYIFLVVGALDIAHTLSYPGTPAFITPNTTSKAATYWMAARLFSAATILAAAFVSPSPPRWWLRPPVVIPLCIAFIAAVIAVVSEQPAWLPPMAIEGKGLTPLKIGLEWVVVACYTASIGAFSLSRQWPRDAASVLQLALVFGMFSEIAFTQYHSPYDSFNLLGHVLKVASYYYVMRALFVVSLYRPYRQLLAARNDLVELAARNEELYKEAQEHLEEIETSFSMVGAALASSLKLEETIDLIVRLACQILHSDHATVSLRHENPNTMKVLAQRGVQFPSEVPIQRNVVQQAIRTLQPVVVNDLEQLPQFFRDEHRAAKVRSLVLAPIIHNNDVLGAIAVYSPKVGAFGRREADILLAFAQQAAVAINNALAYEREHKIAETLQSSMLPHSVPDVQGFRIARAYIPASSEAEVGGDFYDLFWLPGDKLAVIIGDVSGKGLTAAVHTAMTKYTVRAYALEDDEPSRVLSRLCEAMRVLTPETLFITLLYGVLDVSTRTFTYASAGHEPPILVRADDSGVVDLGTTGPALGIGICFQYTQGWVELEAGDVLVFFTDGLTEARHNGRFFGSEGIAEVVRDKAHLPPHELSQEIIRGASQFAGGELRDDVALLVIKAER